MKKNLVKSINQFLYKSIFFSDITKKEGFIALILIGIYIACFVLSVIFTNKETFFVVGMIFDFLYCLILIILNRKKLHTLGFRKTKLRETLILLGVLLALSLAVNLKQINANEFTIYDFIFNALVYLAAVGFVEEFIFRGYLWPRLVVLCGKHKGTLICGALFGLMHVFSNYKYGNIHFDALYVFNEIWAGVIAQYIFLFLYSCTENIFFPSVLHAAPHFFAVERRVDTTLNILRTIFH